MIEEFLVANTFAFMLAFVRLGTAIMILPGIGDAFVSPRIRLLFAVAMAFVLFPLILDKLPSPMPGTLGLFSLILMEFVIGLFYGTIARFFMSALDTAGMVISFSSSLSNAQLLNPTIASQGSLVGAFMSVTGMVFVFATNLHHLLFMGAIESYNLFPLGGIPDAGSMAELVAKALSSAFLIGVQIGAPFIVLTLIVYLGMGVLARLMPQVQVFLLALPLQILLALTCLTFVLAAGLTFWLVKFEEAMVFFLSAGG
ncbi:MAG: flagellar biosynthetic protein FliR [Alphaproteobacteria bacterium]|nr:flagellar biosynthetic protein FliR [Alphaproteobacteria bacterium]